MKKTKLLFCHLKYDLPECSKAIYNNMVLPSGLGIIMEIASKHSIPYDYFDTYFSGNTNDFLSYYKKSRHKVVLFSAIAGNYSYPYLKYIFKKIKEINPSSIIVLGGPITSLYPKILLEELCPDIIVIGEGEEAFLELDAVDFSLDKLSKIEGIGYRNGKDYFINPSRKPLKSPLENKSCNPLFQDDVFKPFLSQYVERQKQFNRGWEISGSRGCVADCSFCKRVFDKSITYFSADYVVNIMKHVKNHFGLTRFKFLDENFVSNRKNFKAFLDLLEESQINIKWLIRARIDNIPFNFLDRMKKLGLTHVTVGVESVNQEILNFYNKRLIISNYKKELKELARQNLLFAAFILGAPYESEETIKENIDFIRYTGLTKENITVAYLSIIPGTKICNDLFQQGKIKSVKDYLMNYKGDFSKIEFNISKMSDKALIEARDLMYQAAGSNC